MPSSPKHLRAPDGHRRPLGRTAVVLTAVGLGLLGVAGSGVAARAADGTTSTTARATTTTRAAVTVTSRQTTTTGRSSTTQRPTTTAAPATTTTPTTAAPVPPAPAPTNDGLEHVPPTAVIDAGPKGLASGAKGDNVRLLEARLAQLRFNVGKGDGVYDGQLAMAVMAFQKQQGLGRSGRANPETLAKLAVADIGVPFTPTGEPTRVEVDLPKQIAQFWKDGKLVKVVAVSTGNNQRYCVPKDKGGGCDVAVTPGGSYRADRKINGLRESKLGKLYDPVYFNGGIAIHGSGSIPASPASHGCVRVPMWESQWVHDNVGIGDPVYVTGGKIAPVPFADSAPTESADEVTAAPG